MGILNAKLSNNFEDSFSGSYSLNSLIKKLHAQIISGGFSWFKPTDKKVFKILPI